MGNNKDILDLDLTPEVGIRVKYNGSTRWLDRELILRLLDLESKIDLKATNARSEAINVAEDGKCSIGQIGRKVGALLSPKMVKKKNADRHLKELADYLNQWNNMIAKRPKSGILEMLGDIAKKYDLKDFPELKEAIKAFIPKYQLLEKDRLPKKPRNKKK